MKLPLYDYWPSPPKGQESGWHQNLNILRNWEQLKKLTTESIFIREKKRTLQIHIHLNNFSPKYWWWQEWSLKLIIVEVENVSLQMWAIKGLSSQVIQNLIYTSLSVHGQYLFNCIVHTQGNQKPDWVWHWHFQECTGQIPDDRTQRATHQRVWETKKIWVYWTWRNHLVCQRVMLVTN